MIDAYRLAHVANDRLTNFPYWISPSKLCIGDGFPGINSATQLDPLWDIVSWCWTWTKKVKINLVCLFSKLVWNKTV